MVEWLERGGRTGESIFLNVKYCETELPQSQWLLVEELMIKRSHVGLREQKDKSSQETCVNLGAEFRGPSCQSCFLLATAPPLVLISTSSHLFTLNLLSRDYVLSTVSGTHLNTCSLSYPPSSTHAPSTHLSDACSMLCPGESAMYRTDTVLSLRDLSFRKEVRQ